MTSNLKNVPPNWQKVRFNEIAEIATDRVEDPVESGLEYFIGLEHLDTDCIKIKRFGFSKDVCSSKFICRKGDIIFGRRRSYLRKVAITDRDAVVSTDAMIFRPLGDKIYPDFLPCFMQSSIFWKAVHANSEGSMSPRIKWKALATQEFWLPSIEEQKKISELLWSIEDNIQKTEKLVETTEKLKQELLNELLTKGVGHTRFKDSELGRIPEEWEVVKFSNAVEIIGGGTPKTSVPDYWDGDIPWISIDDIKPNLRYISNTQKTITEEGLKNSSTKILKEGFLIISARGTVGLVAQVKKPMAFNQSCYGLNGTKTLLNDFLYYLLTASVNELRHTSYGSTFNSITRNNFDLFLIRVPEIDEQKKIVKILDKIEASECEYKENIRKLNILKKKITNEVLSGKIKV